MLTCLYIGQYFPNECLYVNVTFYEIDTCQLVTRIIAFELVIEIGHPLHKVLILGHHLFIIIIWGQGYFIKIIYETFPNHIVSVNWHSVSDLVHNKPTWSCLFADSNLFVCKQNEKISQGRLKGNLWGNLLIELVKPEFLELHWLECRHHIGDRPSKDKRLVWGKRRLGYVIYTRS